ncbi:unnamed protein product [Durusdinium trenchii]|uniref:S1 motif domain-containing protein n=1 Tax=Durusdinium trenchii TaxID=1381693 RepID=A0ABP0LQI3_9DINO
MALPERPEKEATEEETLVLPDLHSILEGTVASIQPFGAFVRIGKGDEYKDGLVHIRSIAAGRVEKVSDYLDVGDKVWAKVCNVKPEDGKYGLDLRYVNQDTGEDLDPKNREGRFPKGGGKQKKTKTEDLVKDAKAMMEEVKRMKKESKLKKKFLKFEEKRKKKLQKKLKKQADAKGNKAEGGSSSSSSSSSCSLSEATQARLRKEFGFPDPVGAKPKAAQAAQTKSNGQAITLKERTEVSRRPPSSKRSPARRPKAAEDLRGLERSKPDPKKGRKEPVRSNGRGRYRSPSRQAASDSRDSRRRPRQGRRDESREPRRSPRRGRRRRDSRDSRSKSRAGDADKESRRCSREWNRLYASGVADQEPPKEESKKRKAAKPDTKKTEGKKAKQAAQDNGEPPKKAKRKKQASDASG